MEKKTNCETIKFITNDEKEYLNKYIHKRSGNIQTSCIKYRFSKNGKNYILGSLQVHANTYCEK